MIVAGRESTNPWMRYRYPMRSELPCVFCSVYIIENKLQTHQKYMASLTLFLEFWRTTVWLLFIGIVLKILGYLSSSSSFMRNMSNLFLSVRICGFYERVGSLVRSFPLFYLLELCSALQLSVKIIFKSIAFCSSSLLTSRV